jgi:outer membrane usher protein
MRTRRLRLCATALLLSTLLPASPLLAQSPAAEASPARPRQRLIPFEITINSLPGGTWLLLEREGTLFAPAEAFDEWRLTRRAGVAPITHQGKPWYPLNSLPGFEVKMNVAAQSLELVFSPAAFTQSRVGEPTAAERAQAVPAVPAFFVNYDFNFAYTRSRGSGGVPDLGVLGEVGHASQWGVFSSSFVGRHLEDRDPDLPRSVQRLETTFTHNFIEQQVTLRAGDSATRTGLLLRPLYFGGLQLGRNFGLTPGFLTQPLPVIGGTAAAPSTVELYVNDALRQTSRVLPGPFVIDNYPLLTGSGQARIVVRDVLGRESVLVQSFFTHNSMLEQGLSDWSVAAGAVRRNIGTERSMYDERFVAGLWRHGWSKQLTLEADLEVGREKRVLGLGAVAALPWQVIAMAGVAASSDERTGAGRRWVVGAEHQSLRHGFSLHYIRTSRGFAEYALETGALPTAREQSASYTYSDSRLGSIGVAVARLVPYDADPVSTLTLNYGVDIAKRASLNFSVTKVRGAGGGVSANVSLAIPLENDVNVLGFATHRAGRVEGYLTASKAVREDAGIGWRALAGHKDSDPYGEAGVHLEGTKLRLSGDLSFSRQQQAVRLGAQGSLVFMDGSLFAAKRLTNSFAVVEVPGHAGIGIGLHGRVQARTDASGRALVPGLTPFRANSIQIDPKELPISAELDNIEQIVVPPERSGVKVVFPVRSGRGALIRIVFDDDGAAAPAGAEVEIVGDKGEFFVARRGEAFVTGLQPKNRLRLNWNGQSCQFDVELPQGGVDEIARVGPVACTGIRR